MKESKQKNYIVIKKKTKYRKEESYEKAEQSYNKAIEFANLLNDQVLASNLLKEKELDLIEIPST